jgi:hypothetical protein
MPGTRVTQIRKPIITDEGAKYQIVLQCTLPGTLPSAAIFLMQVVQDSDPKNDAFTRLCAAADFDTYGTSRNASITANTRLFRTTSLTLTYDDVATANGAWQELTSRINTLVREYDVYLESFLTPDSGTETTFPTVDPGVKNELIAAYEQRLLDVAEAEDARDDGQRECDVKVLELRTLQQSLQQAQTDYATMAPIKGAVDALVPTYSASSAQIAASANAIRVLNSVSTASAAEKAQIEAQCVALDGALTTLNVANTSLVNDVQVSIAGYVGSLQARITDLTQQVNAKQLEVNECHLEMADLQAAVDEARKQRDASLATLRGVCPDFNPEDIDSGILAAQIPIILGGSP